jgi:hypothetical protein
MIEPLSRRDSRAQRSDPSGRTYLLLDLIASQQAVHSRTNSFIGVFDEAAVDDRDGAVEGEGKDR